MSKNKIFTEDSPAINSNSMSESNDLIIVPKNDGDKNQRDFIKKIAESLDRKITNKGNLGAKGESLSQTKDIAVIEEISKGKDFLNQIDLQKANFLQQFALNIISDSEDQNKFLEKKSAEGTTVSEGKKSGVVNLSVKLVFPKKELEQNEVEKTENSISVTEEKPLDETPAKILVEFSMIGLDRPLNFKIFYTEEGELASILGSVNDESIELKEPEIAPIVSEMLNNLVDKMSFDPESNQEAESYENVISKLATKCNLFKKEIEKGREFLLSNEIEKANLLQKIALKMVSETGEKIIQPCVESSLSSIEDSLAYIDPKIMSDSLNNYFEKLRGKVEKFDNYFPYGGFDLENNIRTTEDFFEKAYSRVDMKKSGENVDYYEGEFSEII